MRKSATLLAVAWCLVTGPVFPGTIAVGAAQSATGGGAVNALTPAEASSGWVLLFDGRSLTDWTPYGDADWKVEDGTITFYKGRGMLRHSKSLTDFELKADFWGEKTANSGVFFRCTPRGADLAQQDCYEVNIFDASPTFPTGSINNVQTTLPTVPNTAEKWNTLDVTVKGTRLTVKLNGQTTVDKDDPKLTSGTLAIQAFGPDGPGRIKFRNVKVRPI